MGQLSSTRFFISATSILAARRSLFLLLAQIRQGCNCIGKLSSIAIFIFNLNNLPGSLSSFVSFHHLKERSNRMGWLSCVGVFVLNSSILTPRLLACYFCSNQVTLQLLALV
jgi:hypothetical protein